MYPQVKYIHSPDFALRDLSLSHGGLCHCTLIACEVHNNLLVIKYQSWPVMCFSI